MPDMASSNSRSVGWSQATPARRLLTASAELKLNADWAALSRDLRLLNSEPQLDRAEALRRDVTFLRRQRVPAQRLPPRFQRRFVRCRPVGWCNCASQNHRSGDLVARSWMFFRLRCKVRLARLMAWPLNKPNPTGSAWQASRSSVLGRPAEADGLLFTVAAMEGAKQGAA